MEKGKQTVRAVNLIILTHLFLQILLMQIFNTVRDGRTALTGLIIGVGAGVIILFIMSSVACLMEIIKLLDTDYPDLPLLNSIASRLFNPLAVMAIVSVAISPLAYPIASFVWGAQSPTAFFWAGFGFYIYRCPLLPREHAPRASLKWRRQISPRYHIEAFSLIKNYFFASNPLMLLSIFSKYSLWPLNCR